MKGSVKINKVVITTADGEKVTLEGKGRALIYDSQIKQDPGMGGPIPTRSVTLGMSIYKESHGE